MLTIRVICLVLVVGVLTSCYPSDEPEEPILYSASVNRLDEMLNICVDHLHITYDQCGCIFSKSFYTETHLSNVDLSFYYFTDYDRLTPEKLSTLHDLKAQCTSVP